jgi:UDP-N-acetylglucosamine 2-epimerase
LWPNIDAGSDHISKVVRVYRALGEAGWMRTLTNLTPENYLTVLAGAACAVGNSSSFVRDAGYFGTPVVLVGNRQNGRETDEHVTRVPVEMDAIVATIRKQLDHGRYPPSTLYGDGQVAGRIAAAIEKLTPYLQKQLAFTLAN